MGRKVWWLLATTFLLGLTSGASIADEAAVRRQVETRLSDAKVLEVRKLPYGGLYEVALRNAQGVRVIYTDADAKVFVIGSLIDSASGENLTEVRLRKLTAIDWKSLPFDSAITMKRGSGRREIAIFSDPNCPYCQHFESDLAKVDDITVHIFMYPVIRPDSVRLTKAVWCSKDRAKAWNDLMLERIEPTAKPDCDTPVEKLVALGHKLGAASTPTWFLRNGEMYKGALPMDEVVQLLDATAKRP
ncbi:MAG: DsbC family protein [Betaproteobacteria bacterium]|nr:DsbC family protein [Betaproteobacteria bacterium]